MIDSILTFFQIIGVSPAAPATLAELIPYLVIVAVGLLLVGLVFQLVLSIARLFTDWRWR